MHSTEKATPMCSCRRRAHVRGEIEQCTYAPTWNEMARAHDRLAREHEKVGKLVDWAQSAAAMQERLDEITACLTEAEAWLFDTLGADGKEEARAWIWAALTELEAWRRLVTYDDDEIRLWVGSNVEQRQSARWPAEVAAVRLKAREE